MKKVKAIITGGNEQFGIWIEGSDIFSAGNDLDELKANLNEAIELHKEAGGEVPKEMNGEYEIEYVFDLSGFLRYYSKFINFAGMSILTGVHQKQLWSYAYGYRNPKKDTETKIVTALKLFLQGISKELSQVQITN